MSPDTTAETAPGRQGRSYGLIKKRPDPRDYRFTAPAPYTGEFVDLSGGFPEQPYDQGQLGSCVPNGTAGCADFARKKAGLPPLNRPSRLFIYYQGRVRGGYPLNQDTGLQIRDGFTVLAKDGAPSESDWPYDISKFTQRPPASAYTDAKHDEALAFGAVDVGAIDATIASGYPVAFGFDVYESFESDQAASTGVIPVPDKAREAFKGGHCMVFCSTPKRGEEIKGGVAGVLYRLTRNSWGHDGSWGLPEKPGYCWFPVAYANDASSVSDFWVVTLMGDPNSPQPTPQPVPPPFPVALGVALDSAEHDPAVVRFTSSKHRGDVEAASRYLREILTAPRT